MKIPPKGDVFIPNEDIDSTMAISEETASNIAKLFIRDIILSQDTNWNVSTAVENVTPLYASNESTVNAYSVELNEGYIVVSAFLDVPSLILEWSDSAEPLYENLDCSNKILYMGGYNYFEGLSNNKVTDLYGKTISDDDLYDIFYNSRDINYIPDNVLVFIADKYASNSNLKKAQIEDPVSYANKYYTGPFVPHDYINKWNDYVYYFLMNSVSGYDQHCGPTTITNIILAYSKKYQGNIYSGRESSVFNNIAQLGINNGYYTNSSNGGTYINCIYNYIVKSMNYYSINATVQNGKSITYNSIRNDLSNGSLLYVSLVDAENYNGGNHSVMCFAYNRMVSQTTGYYLSFLKVADGWNDSGRYVVMGNVGSESEYFPVSF